MNIEVLLFGRLAELLGSERLHLEAVADTDAVCSQLEGLCPALKQLNYQIAVNHMIIHDNQWLTDGMTVALMPPFSGG
ncbi:MoaD/ThiS family protein [Pedobacter cryoconitis]|uniref:Molybdopterin converting factor small subunit n=1 Tax=Pedobacter cryoconitis TaxID=188932 RepID=A0A7X0MLY1_9SPHI|nr:MoaD/ThiS family protein [Pedobacter cryoconitis]MBB6502355.1 molybdopterin converting factor small subunit [Pedobacter cryoconitis]